jgi:hypothetical protein
MELQQSITSVAQPIIPPSTPAYRYTVIDGKLNESYSGGKHIASLCVDLGQVQNDTSITMPELPTHHGIFSTKRNQDNPQILEVRFDTRLVKGKQIVQALFSRHNVRPRIAFIYFKNLGHRETREKILQTVSSGTGVIAAESTELKAFLLMVHFDPRETTGSNIVRGLQKQGFSSLQVGC